MATAAKRPRGVVLPPEEPPLPVTIAPRTSSSSSPSSSAALRSSRSSTRALDLLVARRRDRAGDGGGAARAGVREPRAQARHGGRNQLRACGALALVVPLPARRAARARDDALRPRGAGAPRRAHARPRTPRLPRAALPRRRARADGGRVRRSATAGPASSVVLARSTRAGRSSSSLFLTLFVQLGGRQWYRSLVGLAPEAAARGSGGRAAGSPTPSAATSPATS